MQKRYILICCLCLLASLSFANEIPLILEETIQLPNATPYWDVLPRWDYVSYWISARDNNSSEAQLFWGNTQEGIIDSFYTIGRGKVTALCGYYLESVDNPCVTLSTNKRIYSDVADTSWCETHRLIDGSEIIPASMHLGYESLSTFGGHSRSQNKYFLIQPLSPPPQITQEVMGVFGRNISNDSYHGNGQGESENIWQAMLINDVLDSASTFTDYFHCYSARSCYWGTQQLLAFWSTDVVCNYYISYDSYRYYIYLCNWDLAGDTASVYNMRTPPGVQENTSKVALAFDAMNSRPILLTDWRNGITDARTPSDTVSLWELSIDYREYLEAYVLIGDYSEQVLAYDADRQLFDIIRIEDGSIWGQTSQLPNDYNELKIIGRYHNNYRRLAVRYGDEIRIYSFGDPVITDADDTPTIPHAYLFTAYPNPFNPSTALEFSLPVYEDVRLSVFNTIGQEVAVLTDEQHSPGKYSYPFDASALPSGIYFARLSINASQTTKKLVLLK